MGLISEPIWMITPRQAMPPGGVQLPVAHFSLLFDFLSCHDPIPTLEHLPLSCILLFHSTLVDLQPLYGRITALHSGWSSLEKEHPQLQLPCSVLCCCVQRACLQLLQWVYLWCFMALGKASEGILCDSSGAMLDLAPAVVHLVLALSQCELVVLTRCLRCDDWVVKRKMDGSALL